MLVGRHDEAPPDSPEEAENAIVALTCTERMKAAVRLVAEGMAFRDAAVQVGYRDHREVYRWAKRAGLLEVHTKRLVDSYRRIAALSNAELERRLTEAPEEIATKDLAVISGISADKAAKYEGWGKQADDDPGPHRMLDWLEEMVKSGRNLELKVSPHPRDAEAIDVRPARREWLPERKRPIALGAADWGPPPTRQRRKRFAPAMRG